MIGTVIATRRQRTVFIPASDIDASPQISV
jgi:hypothetical protein